MGFGRISNASMKNISFMGRFGKFDLFQFNHPITIALALKFDYYT